MCGSSSPFYYFLLTLLAEMTASTYEYEESLPQLPVPLLSATVEQLLAALKPLLLPDEYSVLEEESKDLLNNNYLNLIQQHLVAASRKPDHSCYLNSINDEVNPGIYGELNNDILPRNPYLVLEEDPYLKTINPPNQFQRAALLTNSSLKFILSLRNGSLKPDLTPKNKNPLTMNCYKNLFGTTRFPDNDHVSIKKSHNSKAIIVIVNNRFYELEVLDSDLHIWFNDYELSLIFEYIVTDATQDIDSIENVNNSIGSLTTQTFRMWKKARKEMNLTSPDFLNAVDLSLFVVVLDHMNSPELDQEKTSVISHGSSKLLSGTSVQVGSCTSRWYDKLQLIVTANSVAGVVWESASMDLTAILRYISDIYTDLILKLAKDINGAEYTLFDKSTINFVSAKESKPHPKHLTFEQTPKILHLIRLLETRLADLINQHEYKTLTLKLDAYLVSHFQVPVDSFLQIALQIAYYTLYGKLVNTLEPITTRKFRDARTELIPIQNEAVSSLVRTFITTDDPQLKWKKFKECCDIHGKQYLEAMHGKGFQRHFLALIHCVRLDETKAYLNTLNSDLPKIPPATAGEGNTSTDIPVLFTNPAIDKISSPELLISNCGNPALHLFGITPAIDQGFGIGYIIHSDKVIITISSKHRQTERFLDTFLSVVQELRGILRKLDNFKYAVADTDKRKQEIEDIEKERTEAKTSPNSRSKSIPITLDIDGNEILSAEENVSEYSPNSGKSSGFDVFGGYGYFDFGELDHRSKSALLSHSDSFMNSEISISIHTSSSPHSRLHSQANSTLHSNSNSRLQSRHHSHTNLQKLSDDIKQKISLSDKIRDRLQNIEPLPDFELSSSKHEPKPRKKIGKAISMTGI